MVKLKIGKENELRVCKIQGDKNENLYINNGGFPI